MKPGEFKRQWEVGGDALIVFPADYVASSPIPNEAKQFLSEEGLPRDAAPFLSFGPTSRPWGLLDCLEIGANGSGDPITIMADGTVLYRNHDADFAGCYINRDLATLAASLLRFRLLISETQRACGPDGYLDGLVPPNLGADFTAFLSSVDADALQPGAMWADEIANWSQPILAS